MVRLGFALAAAFSLIALARGQCDGDGKRRRYGNSFKIDLPLPENIEKAKTILDQYPVVDGLVYSSFPPGFSYSLQPQLLGTMIFLVH